MRPLGLPQCFPEPQSMKNCSTSTWIAWTREENNDLITAIDEENARRRDPDDPFDGTAGGIFAPLQHEDEHEVHQPQNTSGLNGVTLSHKSTSRRIETSRTKCTRR